MQMLALIAAGEIKEDDGYLGLIQNVDLDAAKGIAQWLSMATKGSVQMRHIDILTGATDIELTYEQALAKITRTGAGSS